MIEVTRGSTNKYEVEKETGQLMLDRVLHSAVYYPGDYGYIPHFVVMVTLWIFSL